MLYHLLYCNKQTTNPSTERGTSQLHISTVTISTAPSLSPHPCPILILLALLLPSSLWKLFIFIFCYSLLFNSLPISFSFSCFLSSSLSIPSFLSRSLFFFLFHRFFSSSFSFWIDTICAVILSAVCLWFPITVQKSANHLHLLDLITLTVRIMKLCCRNSVCWWRQQARRGNEAASACQVTCRPWSPFDMSRFQLNSLNPGIWRP